MAGSFKCRFKALRSGKSPKSMSLMLSILGVMKVSDSRFFKHLNFSWLRQLLRWK